MYWNSDFISLCIFSGIHGYESLLLRQSLNCRKIESYLNEVGGKKEFASCITLGCQISCNVITALVCKG